MYYCLVEIPKRDDCETKSSDRIEVASNHELNLPRIRYSIDDAPPISFGIEPTRLFLTKMNSSWWKGEELGKTQKCCRGIAQRDVILTENESS